jgi:steroid delta-isomerase-like uncharacterized protein
MHPTERIRAYYSAFNAKDWEGMLANIHEDVLHYPNQGIPRKGREALREFILKNAKAYDEELEHIAIFTSAEHPGRLAAEYMVNGTYLVAEPGFPEAQGQKYRLPGGAFFEMKDGLISRISNYYNLEDWLAQVQGS